MNVPIIRLEIQNMKHTIQVALTDYQTNIDKYVSEALDRYCTPENIQVIVNDAATKAINKAVKDCVKSFFLYGAGRRAVKEAVEQRLKEDDKFYGNKNDGEETV